MKGNEYWRDPFSSSNDCGKESKSKMACDWYSGSDNSTILSPLFERSGISPHLGTPRRAEDPSVAFLGTKKTQIEIPGMIY